MPALLRPQRADATSDDDLLGIKFVTGVPANRELGLPAIHATVILSDPATGAPVAILDGGPITAERTAAVSGVALTRFAPRLNDRAVRVTIVGGGVQCASHLEVIGHVLPGAAVTIAARDPDRSSAMASLAASTAGIGAVSVATDIRAATETADVVVTAITFQSPDRWQTLTPDWLAPDALVVAIDYEALVAASVARDAALFVTDELGQFLATRDSGRFTDYPDPETTLGEVIAAGTTRPTRGRVLVTHLGVGLADVVFADAIVRRAAALGLGAVL
jgi:ornithine cyclodeaminase/alanine dehydrogenase-like protein (mu-crystallin family)